MKKMWIILAVIAAAVILGTLAVHYLPVMWTIIGGVMLLAGTIFGWSANNWWRKSDAK